MNTFIVIEFSVCLAASPLVSEYFIASCQFYEGNKKIGPCQILKKVNDNDYKVDLPANLDISPVFNTSDLYIFHGDNTGDDSAEEVD